MSLALVYSRALSGMDAPLVEVEAHLANGLPAFHIVGLADTEVKESRDRVRAAIIQSGFEFPAKKITVNLAPADLPKESGRFDLPIALGVLAASGQIVAQDLAGYECAGELALSGQIRPVRGAIAMAWRGSSDHRAFILPEENAERAALLPTVTVYGAQTLAQVAAHFNGVRLLEKVTVAGLEETLNDKTLPDLADVKGQKTARLALEIAAAGGHSLLMLGPPGTGKTMLAQRLPSILPPMNEDELMQVWSLYSLSTSGGTLTKQRPFRSPHHSSSGVALVGGGSEPRPGEISLAHNGVLFLDELPEFDRRVLEMLREPLESGEIHISRAMRHATFPAKFQLVATMNPCPCGYLGHVLRACTCTPDAIARYRSKISGPLLDRIDLTVEVSALSAEELMHVQAGESSATVRERVLQARERQQLRQGKVNSALTSSDLDTSANIDPDARSALVGMLEKLSLSARSFHRILRIARTLADLSGDETVQRAHVVRAIGFRRAL